MLDRVEQFIETENLLAKGFKIVIAVSGGADSMALLRVMWQLKDPWDLELIAAHVHHGLRLEAEGDLDRVRDECRTLEIELEIARADIAFMAKAEKRSLEEMGRMYRYRFFAQVMEKHGADRIATAHHMEDNAESVLAHLLRGSGYRGMRGILPVNGHIIRPLLCANKDQIMNYVRDQGILYVQDASNMDTGFTRNRIRHELIPYLEKHFNPQLVDGLNRLADIARYEDEWMQDIAGAFWQQAVTTKEDSLEIAVIPFLKAPLAAQRRLVLELCRHFLGSEGWQKSDIDQIINLAQRVTGSSRYLGLRRGLMVYKVYDKLVFTTSRPRKVSFSYPLAVPGKIAVDETGDLISCFVGPGEEYIYHGENTCLDWDRLLSIIKADGNSPLSLVVRSRLPGDRLTPPKASNPTKLKKYLIERKIPWADRDKIPILASNRRIFALVGEVVDQDVQVSAQTTRVLVIKREKPSPGGETVSRIGSVLDNCIE